NVRLQPCPYGSKFARRCIRSGGTARTGCLKGRQPSGPQELELLVEEHVPRCRFVRHRIPSARKRTLRQNYFAAFRAPWRSAMHCRTKAAWFRLAIFCCPACFVHSSLSCWRRAALLSFVGVDAAGIV